MANLTQMGAPIVHILNERQQRCFFQFFLTDALGTVRDVVDDTGAVIQSYEFNEHGIPMPGSGAGSGTFSPKTFQGGLSVNDDRNDSGLYLMGHRHYAADLGRFISRDPIGFAGGLNLFGTAFGNNPVTFVDPTGLDWRLNGNGNTEYQSTIGFSEGIKTIATTAPGSITTFELSGHGSAYGQSMDAYSDASVQFQNKMRIINGELYLQNENGLLEDQSWRENLGTALADNANVIFTGCATGTDSPEALARAFSALFPNVNVFATPEYCLYDTDYPDYNRPKTGKTKLPNGEIDPESVSRLGNWNHFRGGAKVSKHRAGPLLFPPGTFPGSP